MGQILFIFLLFFLFIFFFLFSFAVRIVNAIITFIRHLTGATEDTTQPRGNSSDSRPFSHGTNQPKIFSKDEGEYIDFEEEK